MVERKNKACETAWAYLSLMKGGEWEIDDLRRRGKTGARNGGDRFGEDTSKQAG